MFWILSVMLVGEPIFSPRVATHGGFILWTKTKEVHL